VLGIRNDFLSDSDQDHTFQLDAAPASVLDPDPVWYLAYIFYEILDINFTLVFLPCKGVRLLIMTRYELFRG
jgi:hypothetical protein